MVDYKLYYICYSHQRRKQIRHFPFYRNCVLHRNTQQIFFIMKLPVIFLGRTTVFFLLLQFMIYTNASMFTLHIGTLYLIDV